MTRSMLFGLSAAAVAIAAPASADTITFDDLAFDGGAGTPAQSFASVASGGFVFTALAAGQPLLVRARNDPNNADPGGATLGITTVGNDPGFSFARADGAAFDLASLDLTHLSASLTGPGNSGTFRVYLDGVLGFQSSFDGNPPFQTYAVEATGVRSVRITGINYFQVDNLVVSGSVPEPAGWAMMVTGFGMLGAALRRRPVPAPAG